MNSTFLEIKSIERLKKKIKSFMFNIHRVYQESTLSDLFLRLCRIDVPSPHLPPLVHLGMFIVIGDTVA